MKIRYIVDFKSDYEDEKRKSKCDTKCFRD